MNRYSALQVRKAEGRLSISPVNSADQLKEDIIFGNWHQLAVAKSPSCRRKVSAEHSNFTNIGLRHGLLLLQRKIPGQSADALAALIARPSPDGFGPERHYTARGIAQTAEMKLKKLGVLVEAVALFAVAEGGSNKPPRKPK
jgi:hypothetical protein